jgi:hypothetical protein
LYRLTLKLPPDASLQSGRRFEASIKSNHPKFPLIKIPVVQVIRQVAAPAARRPITATPSRSVVTPPLPPKPQ